MPFRTGKSPYWQYDIIVKGDRFRGSTGTKDYEEAKAVEAKIRSDAKSAAPLSYTLSEALGTYYRDVSQHQPSAATTRNQSRAILAVMDGDKKISKLTNADILTFVAKRRSTVTNATVNRQLQLIGRALRHMTKYGATVPDLDLRGAETKEPKERVRELSLAEQIRLFEKLPNDILAPVQFCLLTGARISTMAELRWSDVDHKNRELIFRLKGGDSMTFPLSRELSALLSSLPRSNVKKYSKLVFTRLDKQTMERTRIVSNGGVFNTQFRQALVAAEIDDFRFHDLRHTFATRMLRQTNNLKLVSRLLGHKDIATTMRYAHVMVDDMRLALDEFSPLSQGVPQNFPQIKSRNV